MPKKGLPELGLGKPTPRGNSLPPASPQPGQERIDHLQARYNVARKAKKAGKLYNLRDIYDMMYLLPEEKLRQDFPEVADILEDAWKNKIPSNEIEQFANMFLSEKTP